MAGQDHRSLQRSPSAPEPVTGRSLADGSSLLDHTLVAYGSSLRQGHGTSNVPLLLAGHGGGGLKQGQNIVYQPKVTPLANLWLSTLRHVGVKTNKFANSQNVLTELGFE